MSSFAFVADAQGFIIDRKFVPREFSIKDEKRTLHYVFKIDNCELSAKEMRSAWYNFTKVHGLTLKCGYKNNEIPSTLIPFLVKSIYTDLTKKKKDKRLIAVNNCQLAARLKDLGLPVTDIMIPKTYEVDPTKKCSHHFFESSKCSLVKVDRLYKFLDQ